MKISKKTFNLILISIFLTVCSRANSASNCQIVYDAGSSGTRLYIYEQQGDSWVEHRGPKVSALADPVREIRGKTWADADAVVAEVVGALDEVKPDFDWSTQCQLDAAQVLATAGMRIAEQEDRDKSESNSGANSKGPCGKSWETRQPSIPRP
ncbi:MAG: hypothetical protein GKR94_13955 [Gammaproteobacteria bacterium]|nr:hypothetical protein [Gammaproteobacteria bacterium]